MCIRISSLTVSAGRVLHHHHKAPNLLLTSSHNVVFFSAVDPVAVLAIFQEIGVNSDLYYIVLGESVLNDGVAVVFYNMMIAFSGIVAGGQTVTPADYGFGLLSFVTIAFGGLAIGVAMGLLSGLLTRATREVEIVEPLAVLGTAYSAYYLAEVFHWSGIISLIGCGLTQVYRSLAFTSD